VKIVEIVDCVEISKVQKVGWQMSKFQCGIIMAERAIETRRKLEVDMSSTYLSMPGEKYGPCKPDIFEATYEAVP
jgi:hypothetical protein